MAEQKTGELISGNGDGYVRFDSTLLPIFKPLIDANKVRHYQNNKDLFIYADDLRNRFSLDYKKTFEFSPTELEIYNFDKRIPLEEAYNLIRKQNDPKLPVTKLEDAVKNEKIRVHSFEEGPYFNRLDLGRVYHEKKTNKSGLTIERYFTQEGQDPFSTVGDYEDRDIVIKEKNGGVIFNLHANFPKSWSDNSAIIAASKYFFNPEEHVWREQLQEKLGRGNEYSPRHLFSRVSQFFSDWGEKLGYFRTEDDKKIFEDELNFLQINQMAAFNSPVYFNAGLFNSYGVPGSKGMRYIRDPETGNISRVEDGCYTRPQLHACFIIGPGDDLESLLNQVPIEGAIFSDGSGVGHDLSYIREKKASISSGGKASGPMSYFILFDTTGGIIESGGKTRRAARMTTMKQYHPDIMEFIQAKPHEDHKALLLMQKGIQDGFEGDAYKTVKFQNTNLSVRLDEYFFSQLKSGGDIELRSVKNGHVIEKVNADYMLKSIAFGSWRIGDPAVQYESKIQEMHTCANSGAINSSNPCSEYMFLDDTSCNLNSVNLLRLSDKKGNFKVEAYKKANRIMMIAADIANDAGSYPHPRIAQLSPEFRTTGVGYANIGALLMRKGIPYDSPEGRAYAAAITSVMQGETLKTSAEMASALGTFVHYEFNKNPMAKVVQKHRDAVEDIGKREDLYGKNFDFKKVIGLEELIETGRNNLSEAVELGNKNGFRNAQTTVLAPTGTIGRLMDCDATGVEPCTGLIIYKILAGGGSLKEVVQEIPNALENLGYNHKQIHEIMEHVDRTNGLIEGAPHLDQDHYAIFDTAFSPDNEGRTINFGGHVKMLGATQPFISGAISKTNNLPHNATVKEIYDGYILGHKLGIKAISVFRYDSKPVMPLSFGNNKSSIDLKRGEKKDLPYRRHVFETEVDIAGTPIHMLVSEYEDGTPGQIAFLAYKEGSTIGATLKVAGVSASKALKRGVQLESVIDGWMGQEFEPKGLVRGHPHIKQVNSPLDFAAKVLALEYLGDKTVAVEPEKVDTKTLWGYLNGAFKAAKRKKVDAWSFDHVIKDPELGGFVRASQEDLDIINSGIVKKNNARGVPCPKCGKLMKQKKANCYECTNCYESIGSCGG